MTHKTTKRFDALEAALFCAAVAIVVFILTMRAFTAHAPQPPFAARYGGTKHSLGPEEWIARDFFHDQRGGVFVDIGSGDPMYNSNTYYLEHALGWSGVAVDARAELAESYGTVRPRTRFAAFFVADRIDARVVFNVIPGRPHSSSVDKAFAEYWADGGKVDMREVQTVTLNDLLPRMGVSAIDYLTMDIELGEPKALAGFDIARFHPRLVCIEGQDQVRQEIINYFTDHGYVVVGKYWPVDRMNLYFMPR